VGSLAAEPEEPPAATKEGEGETERVSSEEKGGEEKPPEPEKKKRGRPKGSKNRPKETLLGQELPPKKAKKAAPEKKAAPKKAKKAAPKKAKKAAKAKAA